jgi:hypothetical protein
VVRMETVSIVLDAGITIFALGLLLVSLFSYRKYKNSKLLFVSFVFLIFFVKGIILSVNLFNSQSADIISSPYFGLFDLIIIVLLFVATLKR